MTQPPSRSLLIVVSLICFLSLACAAQQNPSTKSDPKFSLTHYGLRFHVKPGEQRLDAQAELTFSNSGASTIDRVPLMLNRLLRVESVADAAGHPLPFTQQVVSMADSEFWQVNQVSVQLPEPFAPGKELRLALRYRGTLAGNTEVMRYVRDRVDEKYTLLRAETMPYPVLGTASEQSWTRLYDSSFRYDVSVRMPKDYVLACGAMPTTQKAVEGDVEFSCSATEPQSQLNLAIAKFKILEDAPNKLRVYALPEDAAAGASLLVEMKRARDFFASYFGTLPGTSGLSVIELPDGWGSYAGVGFVFQTSASFKDRENLRELYHEVSHRWNATPDPELRRTRWFDEAFASYFEALALRALSSDKAYHDDLERARSSYVREAHEDERAINVPIAQYGKYDIGQYSYLKGPWSLYVLHQTIGEEAFRKVIAEFLTRHQQKPATFQDFQRIVKEVTGRDLQSYFDEWIYGTESSHLLLDNVPIETIAARYKH